MTKEKTPEFELRSQALFADIGKREQVVTETANILLVGDRVNLFADQPGAPFGWATVVCVTPETVELVRPYIHTSDFTFGTDEALMSYIGCEHIKLDRQHSRLLSVVFRSSIPK